jgi:hypothetical protein
MMRKIKLLYIGFLLCAILLQFNSCVEKENSSRESVITQTISMALDSLSIDLIDSSTLIHFEYRSKIKKTYMNRFIISNSQKVDKVKLELVQKLIDTRADSLVKYRFDNFQFRTNLIVERSPQNEKYFSEKNYFGTVNITDPVFDNEERVACYYLALNCSGKYSGCSVGALIFVEHAQDNTWLLKEIYPIWEGG